MLVGQGVNQGPIFLWDLNPVVLVQLVRFVFNFQDQCSS